MRVALCFAGQARAFELGYEFYRKNLLDHFDVDVYIHTWHFEESNKLIHLYKPKSILIENPISGDYDEKYVNTPNLIKWPPRFTFSSFYSIKKVSTLIDGNYDWVIKSRTDFALNVEIPFHQLDNTKLYIPNCRIVPERDFGNDQFAFSSQTNMKEYMSTFDYIDQYYNDGTSFIGEDLMQANIRRAQLIGNNLIYYDMNNPFCAGPHNLGGTHSLIRNDYDKWAGSN